MKLNKKKAKVDKDDLGFHEEVLEEGFFHDPVDPTFNGTLIKSFSFCEEGGEK